jgi:hypothetical protein
MALTVSILTVISIYDLCFTIYSHVIAKHSEEAEKEENEEETKNEINNCKLKSPLTSFQNRFLRRSAGRP